MPREPVFTREDLLNAALAHLREKGLHDFSARNVTRRIPASTAPLYSHFRSMEALERAALHRVRDILMEFATREYTDHPFLNIGLGIVLFAREEKMLYRTLYMERNAHRDILEEIGGDLFRIMSAHDTYAQLPERDRRELLQKMSIVTHGLASMICSGIATDDSNEFILRYLYQIGASVIHTDLDMHGIPRPKDPEVLEFQGAFRERKPEKHGRFQER